MPFLQISWPREVRFSKRFLHWNRGIEMVVLSTMKGTNGVFKNPKNFPASLKNCLKNPKLWENLTWLGKKGFSFWHLWPLIEWNQVKYSIHLFFVPQGSSNKFYIKKFYVQKSLGLTKFWSKKNWFKFKLRTAKHWLQNLLLKFDQK